MGGAPVDCRGGGHRAPKDRVLPGGARGARFLRGPLRRARADGRPGRLQPGTPGLDAFHRQPRASRVPRGDARARRRHRAQRPVHGLGPPPRLLPHRAGLPRRPAGGLRRGLRAPGGCRRRHGRIAGRGGGQRVLPGRHSRVADATLARRPRERRGHAAHHRQRPHAGDRPGRPEGDAQLRPRGRAAAPRAVRALRGRHGAGHLGRDPRPLRARDARGHPRAAARALHRRGLLRRLRAEHGSAQGLRHGHRRGRRDHRRLRRLQRPDALWHEQRLQLHAGLHVAHREVGAGSTDPSPERRYHAADPGACAGGLACSTRGRRRRRAPAR